MPGKIPDDIFISSQKIYYRFYGKKSLYNYCYPESELNEFALKLREKMDVVGNIYIKEILSEFLIRETFLDCVG